MPDHTLREAVEQLPRRQEPISGQMFSYVKLDDVLALIDVHNTGKVYQVWDHDPMDGSMGRDYISSTHTSLEDAERAAEKLNAEWLRYWKKVAPGREKETWNWKHARVEEVPVKRSK